MIFDLHYQMKTRFLGWLCAIAVIGICSGNVLGSDHADPVMVRLFGRPESNLTGLFVFEQNDKLVIALCARPGLAENFVNLRPHDFAIHIDRDATIRYANERNADQERTFRYGGWITKPSDIREDVSIRFRFGGFKNGNPFESVAPGSPISLTPEIEVMTDGIEHSVLADQTRSWVGLRDDPFILYGFSTTNVVAMVVEIPFEALGGKGDLLVWGTASRYGKQIDHVGRSLRTMLPRFDFLNGLHPSKHVMELRRRHENPGLVQDVTSTYLSPFFGIRHYDFEPDVLIFSRKRWHSTLSLNAPLPPNSQSRPKEVVAFPNGRRLTDDVATLMCERGDCLLFEVSTSEAHEEDKTHPTTNGKPFLDHFPYLAEPNENPISPDVPSLHLKTKIVFGVIGIVIVGIVLLPWLLWWKARKRWMRTEDALRVLT